MELSNTLICCGLVPEKNCTALGGTDGPAVTKYPFQCMLDTPAYLEPHNLNKAKPEKNYSQFTKHILVYVFPLHGYNLFIVQ